jgi:hypothetical protein
MFFNENMHTSTASISEMADGIRHGDPTSMMEAVMEFNRNCDHLDKQMMACEHHAYVKNEATLYTEGIKEFVDGVVKFIKSIYAKVKAFILSIYDKIEKFLKGWQRFYNKNKDRVAKLELKNFKPDVYLSVAERPKEIVAQMEKAPDALDAVVSGFVKEIERLTPGNVPAGIADRSIKEKEVVKALTGKEDTIAKLDEYILGKKKTTSITAKQVETAFDTLDGLDKTYANIKKMSRSSDKLYNEIISAADSVRSDLKEADKLTPDASATLKLCRLIASVLAQAVTKVAPILAKYGNAVVSLTKSALSNNSAKAEGFEDVFDEDDDTWMEEEDEGDDESFEENGVLGSFNV